MPKVTSGSMQQCGHAVRDRQTDRHVHVTNIHVASSTTHAKCKYYQTISSILQDKDVSFNAMHPNNTL